MKFVYLLIFVLGIACSQLPQKRSDKLSILQGATSNKEVEFSVLAPKAMTLQFELRDADGTVIKPDEAKIITRDYSEFAVHKIIFLRDSKVDYNLYAFENDKVIDQRLIGRGQLEDKKLRLAVASCMDDHYEKHFKIWEALAAKNPEYLLLLGDNVYANITSSGESVPGDPEFLWRRYVDVRLTLPLYFQEKLIPVHAIWDDHDYGMNNGNEDYEHKLESKEIFNAFFAQSLDAENVQPGLGTGSFLSLGDYNLYFLDSRSFRAKSPDGRHLGHDQEKWLMGKLKEEERPSFIIKGDQFFGGYHHFDSFEGNHPKDFSDFVGDLRKMTTPFILLSGDRHMSEIMQFPRGLFGRPSFEITSGPIHSKLYPQEESASTQKNPWRVVAETSHMNFTLIDNLAKNDHWFLDVESVGENGETYYRRELAVYIKDLQNNLNEVRKRRSGRRRYRRSRPRR